MGFHIIDFISATAKVTSADAVSSRRVATCRLSEEPTACAGDAAGSCGVRIAFSSAGTTQGPKGSKEPRQAF